MTFHTYISLLIYKLSWIFTYENQSQPKQHLIQIVAQ